MPSSVSLRTKDLLGTMMFLEFFIWGSWFVTLGSFLAANFSATGTQSALAYSTQSWGAILAPFIVGFIADRYLNAERLLCALHAIGALLLYRMYAAARFDHFYGLLLPYMVGYMPTLALVNSIAFRSLGGSPTLFSRTRVWGTVGWIVAGLAISLVFRWDSSPSLGHGGLRNTFLLGAIASGILACISLLLPATPPSSTHAAAGARVREALGGGALWLLGRRDFLVMVITSVLICIPLAFYYQLTHLFLIERQVYAAAAKQSLGQVSEVAFLFAVPWFIARLGYKGTLMVSMGAWTARYLLFSLAALFDTGAAIVAAILLHGVCYDFFFVCGQIFTDRIAAASCKSAAQGLMTLSTYGVGMLIGFSVAGTIAERYVVGATHDWSKIWLVPAALSALTLVAFALVFREPTTAHGRAICTGTALD